MVMVGNWIYSGVSDVALHMCVIVMTLTGCVVELQLELSLIELDR